MRLSRGTIILIAALVVVIIAALVINNDRASAPTMPTPSPTVALGGPLFETLDANQEAINRLQVRDNNTGESVVYVRTEDGLWIIEGSSASIDQLPITSTVQSLAGLDANDTFEGDDPAAYGLDEPEYSVFISTSDGDAVYVMHVGGKTFNNARHYVTTTTISAADLPAASPLSEATAEAASEVTPEAEETVEPIVLSGTITISTIPQRIVGTDILQLFIPALLPESTPEVTVEATVEATEIMELISTPDAAEATEEATPEATPEVTAEATEAE